MATPAMVDSDMDVAVLKLIEAVETHPACGITSAEGKIVGRIQVHTRAQATERLASLHALELGDVAGVQLAEKLMIYGYPRTGSDTITASEASCCGFAGAHIKMHGNIDNGFSGGPVVSMRDGKVVGIMSYSKGHVDYAVSIEAVARLIS